MSILEASWAILEASWRHLGGILEASGGILENFEGKINKSPTTRYKHGRLDAVGGWAVGSMRGTLSICDICSFEIQHARHSWSSMDAEVFWNGFGLSWHINVFLYYYFVFDGTELFTFVKSIVFAFVVHVTL